MAALGAPGGFLDGALDQRSPEVLGGAGVSIVAAETVPVAIDAPIGDDELLAHRFECPLREGGAQAAALGLGKVERDGAQQVRIGAGREQVVGAPGERADTGRADPDENDGAGVGRRNLGDGLRQDSELLVAGSQQVG